LVSIIIEIDVCILFGGLQQKDRPLNWKVGPKTHIIHRK
jgi:hypothetical protein